MRKTLIGYLQPLLKSLVLLGLISVLWFGQGDAAWALSRGGRMGGGSFRAPMRPMPTRTYQPPGGGYGGGFGGGFGFPFLIPIFGFGGGGGLFSIFIVIAIAGFLMRTVRSITSDDDTGFMAASPKISVAKLQVGLLADARTLQDDLNRLATTADTSSPAGLAQVLQETTLSLLRHPEYWVYGATTSKQAQLQSAEAEFNRLALTERSKFSEESLSNVNNQLRQAAAKAALPGAGGALVSDPGEYIIATIIVGAEGDVQLPAVNGTAELRQAISQLGAISGDRLLALEVLWTPQAENDTLSQDDVIANYPDLKVI